MDAAAAPRNASSYPSPRTSNNLTARRGDKVDHRKYRSTEPESDSFLYWSEEDVNEAIRLGTVMKGPLRVNPSNYRQCFMPHTNNAIDVYVPWRNRGLNGDLVAVHLLERRLSRVLLENVERFIKQKIKSSIPLPQPSPKHSEYVRLGDFLDKYPQAVKVIKDQFPDVTKDFSDKFLQPVGVVVFICEKKHSRLAAGALKPNKKENFALFEPNDSRFPRMNIPMQQCPKNFAERPQDYKNVSFVAELTQWKEGCSMANGKLVRSLGSASEIEPMTEAILMEHAVDYEDFTDQLQVNQCLPSDSPGMIPPEEAAKRRDFTKKCVFTIDPANARDLDDALSCRQIDKDTYEVGVHIADVSYFIKEGTELDRTAASRATSVYLVQRVIPMLPRLLCEDLCSLNPGEKRLAFSVVWHVDIDGNITDEPWFGRTVIKSCVKLSYQHAQGFIEEPDRVWREEELPKISDGFTVEDIRQRVLTLDKIAKRLRERRFDDGALRLDKTKLSYSLSTDTGRPTGFFVSEQKDSNRLIEEFMLLANMAVARKIYKSFPKKAVLRRHPEPQEKQLFDLEQTSEAMGLHIDTTSSKTMQESLEQYAGGDTIEEVGKMQVLLQMCTKPMQRALYFCTGSLDDESLFRHYALSVPFYTHFTSPIRRYADVMVHRLLAASLGYCNPPAADTRAIEGQAKHCNDKKNQAKDAGDLSVDMFFVAFLKDRGPITEEAMIMAVLDHSIDVVCIKLGYKKRVYVDRLNLQGAPVFNNQGATPTLTITWPSEDGQGIQQTLKLFDIIKCELRTGNNLLEKFQAVLLPPNHPSEAAANQEA